MSKHRTKSCEAEALAAHINGECEHVQRIHDDYGMGCIFRAKHSVVLRDLSLKPEFKKIILRVCDMHFEKMMHTDLLVLGDTQCCFGTDNAVRANFRRNRL